MARSSFILHWSSRWSLALLLGSASVLAAVAQTPSAPAVAAIDVNQVAAAYLLNFARFTEWPKNAWSGRENAPFMIGVSGNRPLLDALIQLVDQQLVHGRRVQVMRIKDLDDLADCQLVYLSSTRDGDGLGVDIDPALAALYGKPVLTVAWGPDFLAAGGVVRLVREDSRLRFEISLESAQKTGLTINSRLLALARPVATPP